MPQNDEINQAITQEDSKVANLAVVNHQKIRAGDVTEQEVLFKACVKYGFFYLDLSHDEDVEYLEVVDRMFEVSKEYFARPLEEKLKDTAKDMNTFNICGSYTSNSSLWDKFADSAVATSH